jgi:hypothetical protein
MLAMLRRPVPSAAVAMTLTLFLPQSLTALEGPTSTPQADVAQDASAVALADASGRFAREAGRLVGVWEAQVTRRVCTPGSPSPPSGA